MDEANLSTAQVARRAGIHKATLLRWLREKKIPEPRRDANAWRIFSEDEAAKVERFAKSAEPPSAAQAREIERLESIDWDFVDAKTSYLTHGLHPYPAKYIPQLPNALIQELSSVGETVADVFCGSGTTLVEALTLKRNAIGIDANPLACLISEAKTSILAPPEIQELKNLEQQALSLASEVEDRGASLFGDNYFVSDAPRPADEAITFWFEAFVVEELAEILSWCNAIQSSVARNVAIASFSAIIVSVSKQDSDTRYVRRDKNIRRGDVFKRFARSIGDAAHSVEEFTELVEPRFKCHVYEADILTAHDVEQFDLLVCSPPYPNAYSYHLYHRTRMVWLGMDQPAFKKIEIGSHRKYGLKSATIETFQSEMSNMFNWVSRHLRNGRYACFVVGDSIIKGNRIDNATLMSEAAASFGFKEVARIGRRLQDTKKSFNPTIGKIKTEKILILQLF